MKIVIVELIYRYIPFVTQQNKTKNLFKVYIFPKRLIEKSAGSLFRKIAFHLNLKITLVFDLIFVITLQTQKIKIFHVTLVQRTSLMGK